ncbi:uncharacterized protein Z519_10977 [Cladophialophora bantiana CBS 173.52]|uniref:Glucose-methanol-choline oxidoreductase N-terminal domain-containing protein n=1 Tax=Cladophialophora bantiana (strain ATCC 10958 / CBS 173.52 / CDC B-1940 / NIH 8579) TaxID=1442370 RepID=A0A0D2H520_CLAB1|nr:uncharacterized protein Z519_10977 [Cladophialophora bantiana CBS 173.52]KIW88408.1 hypothetical protein Z519_10977 [Cladophialophora bantiana CBS 173.52]
MGSKQPTDSGVCCSLETFLEADFDYVVVGGGTAGAVVAARLSEDPSVRVGVIEAGQNRLGDPLIETPGTLAFLLRNPDYAWDFTTVPQKANSNKSHHVTRGRVLGGSSAINFMAYCYPSARDLDDLKELGIAGWSWNEMVPYFHKVDHHDPPTNPEPHFYPSIDPEIHGGEGPIHASFATTRIPAEDAVLEALKETSGLPLAKQPYSGEHQGWYGSLSSIDRSTNKGTRSYAATGYIAPILDRPNLRILTGATATKVILDDSKRARGVRFAYGAARDQFYEVHAKAEVILSAGSIQTPQLLELSGIGDVSVLSAAGIPTLVENPHVGANAQEQVMTNVIYELRDGDISLDSIYLDPAFLAAQQTLYAQSRDGVLANAPGLNGFTSYASLVGASTVEQTVSSLISPSSAPSPVDAQQAAILASRLSSPTASALQFIVIPAYCDTLNAHADMSKFMPGPPATDPPANPCISLQAVLMYPASRGSVHITSVDPFAPPEIDYGLLSHPADVDVLAAGLAFADRVFRSPHIKSRVKRRLYPAEGRDVHDPSTARDIVREAVTLINHPLGTCALGKVVDDRLKVMGVEGLRVIDASVLPMELSAFTMATVYAIGEKGAAMIREDRVSE